MIICGTNLDDCLIIVLRRDFSLIVHHPRDVNFCMRRSFDEHGSGMGPMSQSVSFWIETLRETLQFLDRFMAVEVFKLLVGRINSRIEKSHSDCARIIL